MNGISKLLSTDGFIQVNKALIKKLGLHESIMIGELCAEYNHWESQGKLEEGMFYSTRENIEENTGLSEHFQRKALITLKEKELIEVSKRGIPAVNYYKINFDKLLTLLSTSCQSRRQQEAKTVDLNNNEQTKINKEEKVVSKDTTTEFQFGTKQTKPKKENLYSKCVSLIDLKTGDLKIRQLLIDWLNMLLEKYRNTGRVLYANVFKGKLNMLDKFDERDWRSIIEFSIQRGYEGFYPVTGTSSDIKSKPWEQGVTCEAYTKEELEAEQKDIQARLKRGERVYF